MTNLRDIASAMGGTVSGDQVCWPTSGHSAKDRGTCARLSPTAPDGLIVHSHNGGDALAEKDRLREKGVLPERNKREFWTTSAGENLAAPMAKPEGNTGPWRTTGTYEYDNGDGEILYRTRRIERTGDKKRFIAERLENGKWESGLGDVDRLPYRFTELCKAAEYARESGGIEPPIYFVEGERKADKLAEWGLLATAVAFGCKGWREEYGDCFASSTVIILPDNDEPGRAFADTVKAGIESYGGTAVILDLPDLPDKGDIMDWIGTKDDLRALADKALSGSLLPMVTLDLADLATKKAEAKRFVIERVAPAGEVTLFTGPGSGGKSLLGQQLATAAAAGLSCLGLGVAQGPAIYLTCEDSAEQLHWRQQHLCASMGADMASLANMLHLVSLRGNLGNELGTFAQDGTLKPSDTYRKVAAMLRATDAKLLFLDNVAHLFTGNENDRGEVTRFVGLLNSLADQTGAAIILIAHPNKAGDSYSGSTAWLNAVRSQVTIDHVKEPDGEILDPDARVLSVGKANYTQKGKAVQFRWYEWAYVLNDDLPPDTQADIAKTAMANADNEVFLQCLRVRNKQERPVSENIASRTYAPRIFEKMGEAKGLRRDRLEVAMERLFRIKRIERRVVCRIDRKDREGIAEICAEGCADPRADPALTPRADVRSSSAPSAQSHTLYTTYNPGGAADAPPARLEGEEA